MAYPVPESRIDEEVRRAIAKALRKDESVVRMDASVTQELGGSSLDFLDITFRLEKAFGIKLPHNMLVDQIEELFGEGTGIDTAGRLTPGAIEIVCLRLGRTDRPEGEVYADEVPSLVTPAALASGVKEILAHLPAACPACGAAAWKPVEGVKVVCGACDKVPTLPDGDELTQQWLRATAKQRNLFAVA